MRKTDIFEEFKSVCPWAVPHVIDWQESDEFELTCRLDDGCVLIFDQLLGTYRYAESERIMYERRHPNLEKKWRIEFSYNLTRLMAKYGMTQQELSWASGVSQGAISLYISAERTPSLFVATKLVRALGCTGDELLRLISAD